MPAFSSVVPKERLLEFKLGQDGWKELCGFIDFPKPEGEFPNVNDGKMFVAVHILLNQHLRDGGFEGWCGPHVSLVALDWIYVVG